MSIELDRLTRRFGRTTAVDNVSLVVPAGSVFALIGPNGAGKTTTIKIIMNLLRPTAGHARVLGVDSTNLRLAHLARIGYVSENQELPGWMTLSQLCEYVRPFYSTWDDGLRRKLQQGLSIDTRTPLRSLSRGGRMKAALLVSLAFRPDLIVLDEPFTGLDPLVRDELAHALAGVVREHPWTIFISSHDIDEVERLADTVAFLDNCEVVLTESVRALVDKHRQPLRDIFVTLARQSRAGANAGE